MVDASGDVAFYVNRDHILGLQTVEGGVLIHMPDRGAFRVREPINYFDQLIIPLVK